MKYGFEITRNQVAPPDLDDYGLTAARAFWRWVVEVALAVKDASLARGMGVNGRRLRPIAESTRKRRRSWTGQADPDAPPLTPAYGGSRTRALLDGRACADRAEFFWRADPVTGKPWSRILDYHRKGFRGVDRAGRKQFLPVRDVIGLSTADLNAVRRETAARWERFKADRRAAREATPAARPKPRPPARPAYTPPPHPSVVYLAPGKAPRLVNKIQVYREK